MFGLRCGQVLAGRGSVRVHKLRGGQVWRGSRRPGVCGGALHGLPEGQVAGHGRPGVVLQLHSRQICDRRQTHHKVRRLPLRQVPDPGGGHILHPLRSWLSPRIQRNRCDRNRSLHPLPERAVPGGHRSGEVRTLQQLELHRRQFYPHPVQGVSRPGRAPLLLDRGKPRLGPLRQETAAMQARE